MAQDPNGGAAPSAHGRPRAAPGRACGRAPLAPHAMWTDTDAPRPKGGTLPRRSRLLTGRGNRRQDQSQRRKLGSTAGIGACERGPRRRQREFNLQEPLNPGHGSAEHRSANDSLVIGTSAFPRTSVLDTPTHPSATDVRTTFCERGSALPVTFAKGVVPSIRLVRRCGLGNWTTRHRWQSCR